MTVNMLLFGKTNVIMQHFDFESFMNLNARYRVSSKLSLKAKIIEYLTCISNFIFFLTQCKTTYAVPPVAILMSKADISKFDLSRLNTVVCAAASLGQDLEQHIIRKFKLSQIKQGIQENVLRYPLNILFLHFLSLLKELLFFSKP